MMAEKSDGCCCCLRNRNMKITPLPDSLKDIIEIRPNRRIRVRHINPRPRDESFQKELKVYFNNIRTAATTPRVVTVPRLNVNRSTPREIISSRSDTNHNAESLPNMTNSNRNANQNSEINDKKRDNLKIENEDSRLNLKRPLSNKEASDLYSESRASNFSHGEKSVMSASNVHVALDLYGNKSSAAQSVIAETDEPMSSRSSKSIVMQNGLPSSKFSAHRKGSQNVHGEKVHQPVTSYFSPRKANGSATSKPNLKSDGVGPKVITDKDLALFFIHGVGGSSDIWKAQLDYFEKLGCEIICLDLIGHGLSDAPDKKTAYTFDQILIDIQELFDKFCKRKNIIIGHSYGCAFSTVIARERRKWMSKLVLVSGGGPTPLAPQPGVFSLPLCLLACCRPCLNSGFQRGAFHPRFKNTSERQKAFDVPSYVLSYVMNGQHWPDGDDLYHSWISVPTLLVYGRQDGLVDIEEEQEMLKTIYGSHLEIIEDAGHMVMMETPDKFNQLLYNFITDQPLETTHLEPHMHRTDGEDEHLQVTQRATFRSEVSLHSVRSCKSTKSMPHGLLASSIK